MEKRGFTLVELLISLVIFGVISVASIAYFYYGASQQTVGQEQNFALDLAEDKIEKVKVISYGAIPASTEEAFPKYGRTFTRYFNASTVAYKTSDEYKIAHVRVEWKNESGGTMSLNLMSIISETKQ